MELSRTEEVKMSLAKALKVKNRLAGRLAKAAVTVTTYNSVMEGRKGEVEVLVWDRLRQELSLALIELKTAIYAANAGIYRALNELEEKKGEVAFLNGLNTRHGSEPGYEGQTYVYVAAIQKQDVDKRVKQLEKEIDDLQDQLDKYNAEPNRIRVSAKVLELSQ